MQLRKDEANTEFVSQRHELFGFIYALVRNVHDAQDLVQEVWLRFASALESGVRIEKPAAWCRGTAKNLILHHWRDQANAKVLVDSELVELVELAFSEHEEEQEVWQSRRQALADCVEALPEKSKRLLALRYERGEPVAKIAESVHQSLGSVMMALSRLRRLLQKCVHGKLGGGLTGRMQYP
jgi:RNA polymerase sigma-70 factor, ECF subfamily